MLQGGSPWIWSSSGLLVENGYAALFGVDGSFAAGVYKKLPHLIYKVSY
jgi:hypothetical protein